MKKYKVFEMLKRSQNLKYRFKMDPLSRTLEKKGY